VTIGGGGKSPASTTLMRKSSGTTVAPPATFTRTCCRKEREIKGANEKEEHGRALSNADATTRTKSSTQPTRETK
jgi:hypothetical protein